MNKILTIFCFLLVSVCSAGDDAEKQLFNGQITGTIPIKSAPGEKPIKSVAITLESGKKVHVFVEQSFPTEKGSSVTVFKYNDSIMYYLKRD